MRLGVDLDETKIETAEAMLQFYDYNLFGVLMRKQDITNYHMSQIPALKAKGITEKQTVELFDNFHLHGPTHLIKPIAKSRENILKLKSFGAEIITVTARHKGLHNATIDIIDKHFPGLIDDIIFADHYTANHKGKGVICRENDIDIMVEDNLYYAEELVSKGVPVHLLDQPRNRHHNKSHETYGIYHHKDWDGIANAIIGSH